MLYNTTTALLQFPDYGSTILADGAYKDDIKEILRLDEPMGSLLRLQLKEIENLDQLRHFSRSFLPLTLNLKKIWSFYEYKESTIKVKTVKKGNMRFGSTTIKAPVRPTPFSDPSIADDK